MNNTRALPGSAADSRGQAQAIITAASGVVLGKTREIRLALTCLLARGHLLIEDLPGVGKTTLAHLLARLVGLDFQRVQFTSDMLPADITGVYVYSREDAEFRFHPGPVFTNVVLADEINRATPRAQSALLEAMEERQVTIESHTHPLPQPFFVIATQNPSEQIGTFPLPESQLDRFLMCLSLGYPDRAAERALLTGQDRRDMLDGLQPVVDPDTLVSLQGQVEQIHVAEALLDYVQDLIAFSRQSGRFSAGLSPRAGLAMLRAARAWALTDGRTHVLPDDIQAVLPAVAAHRLRSGLEEHARDEAFIVESLIDAVPVP
ncbi:MAG: AAA family ATPase [Gammaproteobacteria bacterium]